MAFANLSVLAFGSLLMGLPILLHLMMKQRPRHQVFPAFRFLHRRQVANQRQLRLRHWLLLAVRLVVVGLIAALLSRPSVDSLQLGYWVKAILLAVLAPLAVLTSAYCWTENKSAPLRWGALLATGVLLLSLCYQGYRAISFRSDSGIGDAQAPVAAAIVFDTSPRMGLVHNNRNRLQEAKGIARDLISQLPLESEVAVVDALASNMVFSLDKGTATNMVNSLEVAGEASSLHELLARGIELVSQRDDKRREVYVLSDLSELVWQPNDYQGVKQQLEQHRGVSLFIVDVGVDQPRNLRLGRLRLSSESIAVGQPLRIQTDLNSLNLESDVTVTVSLERADPTRPVIVDNEVLLPETVQRDRATLSISPGATAALSFELRGLELGTHHGTVTTATADGLPVDDTRYFTLQVRPAWPVLLAYGTGAEPRFVESAISPYEQQQRGQAAYLCDRITTGELTARELSDYAVVCLLDPDPMSLQHWNRLRDYAQQGGSVIVLLGRNALPGGLTVDDFNTAATGVLPGNLHLQWRTGDVQLSVGLASHPILAPFRGRESLVTWDTSPIFRHWSMTDVAPSANVVCRFSNGQPAILESVLERGRIVTMTTPLSDVRNRSAPWNYLPTAEEPLPFFLLTQGLFSYLAERSASPLNHDVGQEVRLVLEGNDDVTWQLFTPAGDWQNARSENGTVTIADTDRAGVYRLKGGDGQAATGFSANLPPEATNLRRLDPEQLDEALGSDRYTVSRGIEQLRRGVGQARVGRELYPFLVVLVVSLLLMEYLMSNRFYGNTGTPTTKT